MFYFGLVYEQSLWQHAVLLLTAPDMGAQLYLVTISSVWMCQTISIAMRLLVAAIAHNYVQNIA
jgi:hypothetical protein